MCAAESFGELNAYTPQAPGRGRVFTEKKFADETLATWETSGLPPEAVVVHVTLYAYRGDRVVLPWNHGKPVLAEGDATVGESGEAAARRVALEQCGISQLEVVHLGHFRCRATVHSKLLPAGATTYRALYGIEVSELADFPTADGFERRIVLQRDLLALIRDRYFELSKEYLEGLDDFVLSRSRRASAD